MFSWCKCSKACNWALLLRPASCSRAAISVKRHETILATKADECPRPPSSLVQHINVLDTLQQQSGTLPTEIDALQRTA